MSKRQTTTPSAKWIPVVVVCKHPLLGSPTYPYAIHYHASTAAYIETGDVEDLAVQMTLHHTAADVEAVFTTGEWGEWEPHLWGTAAKHRKCSLNKLFPRKNAKP